MGNNNEGMSDDILDDTSDASGDAKSNELPDKLQPIYEMELERQKTVFTSRWKSDLMVKINKETNCLIIENDDYFREKMNEKGLSELALNECTISIDVEPIGSENKTIQFLRIAHKSLDPHFKFRLPERKQQDMAERQKFSMFAATLRHCGSQFDKLKLLLLKWNEAQTQNFDESLTNDIIDTFIAGFGYEQFQNRHRLNHYINLVTNMDNKIIKAVEAILALKEFSKEDERWEERCQDALNLQNEWALLLPTIQVIYLFISFHI